jgi:hypothetical protein
LFFGTAYFSYKHERENMRHRVKAVF